MLTDGLTFLNTPPSADILRPSSGTTYPANPIAGQMFFNTTVGVPAVYNGTMWLTLGADPSYDISLFVEGKPSANAILLSFVAPRAYSLPLNLAGSQARAATAPAAQTRFILKKNGNQIGTATFEASSVNATFLGAATTFAIGDVLTVSGEAVPDTALENISLTLIGKLA